jgi:NADPH-dependent 2,4-dienoyl-CoA reductase/sulfur reductase-like enzyme
MSTNPDVLVIGAGPAGMAAAIRARESGARVTVVDDNSAAGGQIWRGGPASHDSQSAWWFEGFRDANIPTLTHTQVISAGANARTLLAETPDRSFEIHFDKLILATGAREIFLPFPGWTLPGIMGAGGLQALAKTGLPVRGTRIVVAGSGPLLLAVAAYLRKHGARVTLVAEQAAQGAIMRFGSQLVRHPEKLVEAITLKFSLAGIPQRYGCWVEAAEGGERLERLRIRQGGKTWIEECDFAAIAYGLCPNVELAGLLGCRIDKQAVVVDEFQQSSIEDILCAGESTGVGGVDLSIVEGEIAGYAACGQLESARRLFATRNKAKTFAQALNTAFALRPELKQLPTPETIVCRCEDVSFQELQSYGSFRAAKLHSRCGMGPCQGRICGPAAHFLFGWNVDSFRPPIFPVRIGSLILE